jgi:hypothetical protein
MPMPIPNWAGFGFPDATSLGRNERPSTGLRELDWLNEDLAALDRKSQDGR